jgi:hypothetical protein
MKIRRSWEARSMAARSAFTDSSFGLTGDTARHDIDLKLNCFRNRIVRAR